MDLLLEVLFEFVLEGCTEVIGSKRVPKPLRIIALSIIMLVIGGLFVLILIAGIIRIMDAEIALGCLFLVFDIIIFSCLAYIVNKFLKIQKNHK